MTPTPLEVLTDDDVALLQRLPGHGSPLQAERLTDLTPLISRGLVTYHAGFGGLLYVCRSKAGDTFIATLDHQVKQAVEGERRRINELTESTIERSHNKLSISIGDMGVFLMNRRGKWFAAGDTFLAALESTQTEGGAVVSLNLPEIEERAEDDLTLTDDDLKFLRTFLPGRFVPFPVVDGPEMNHLIKLGLIASGFEGHDKRKWFPTNAGFVVIDLAAASSLPNTNRERGDNGN